MWGFIQDLRKCYNLIPRYPLLVLFEKSGIPPQLVHMWRRALHGCDRYLECAWHTVGPFQSTTGIPEGDPWSVIGMIIFANLWAKCHTTVATTPLCYADNLELISTAFGDMSAQFLSNLAFQNAWKQEISFGKSWTWATNAKGKKSWQMFLKCLISKGVLPTDVAVVDSAIDLGAVVNYTAKRCPGNQPQRFLEAQRRTRAMFALPLNTHNTARAVKSAVLTVALYGCEVLYPSNVKLMDLRRCIARAMVGPRAKTNAYLAASLLSTEPIDPLYHVILRTLRLFKRMLLSDEHLVEQVWNEAVSFQDKVSGNRKRMRAGPVATLVRIAVEMSWTLQPNCAFTTSDDLKICLKTVSSKDLPELLQETWDDFIMCHILQRKQWHQVDSCDVENTAKIHLSLPAHEQAIMRNTLTGAFASTDMTKHWCEDSHLKCHKCPQAEATMNHILHECDATADVRELWKEWYSTLSDEQKFIMHFPCMPASPYQGRVNKLRQAMEWPATNLHLPPGDRHVFYTDGSCTVAAGHLERHAAWAIVVDKCHLDESRVHFMQEWHRNGFVLPNSFQVCQSGHVPGKQTINRAELFALLMIAEGVQSAEIYSDSQYAVSKFQQILEQPDARRYFDSKNMDILVRLCCRCQETPLDIQIHKICAHQDIQDIRHDLDRYHAMGNALADHAAKEARKKLENAQELQIVQLHRTFLDTQKIHTRMCMQFVAQAAKSWLQCRPSAAERDQAITSTRRGMQISLTSAKVALQVELETCMEWQVPIIPLDREQYLFWGCECMYLLQKWVNTLKWPQANPEDSKSDVTYFELWLDFTLATGAQVPWSHGGTSLEPIYDWDRPGRPSIVPRPEFKHTLAAFRLALNDLKLILDHPVWPCAEVKRAQSLGRAFGFEASVGLSLRPQMQSGPILVEVIERHRASQARNIKSFKTMPDTSDVTPWISLDRQFVHEPLQCAAKKVAFRNWCKRRRVK